MALSSNVQALTPIGEQQGWSGYLMAGVGHSNVESNTVAGNDVELSFAEERIAMAFDA